MTSNFSSTAAFLWLVADLLRGDFKQTHYGHIILPFPLLRCLECIIENPKLKIFAELIAKSTLAIELMQQRLMVLISATVTGKIDVREWECL